MKSIPIITSARLGRTQERAPSLSQSQEQNDIQANAQFQQCVIGWSAKFCPNDGSKLAYMPVTNSDLKELVCGRCGYTEPLEPSLVQLGGSQFDGHGPDEAVVMDNNLGSAAGPERTKQVMSALNQDKKTGPQGLDFHVAKLDVLTLWSMSSNRTDRIVSEILKETIKKIENKRNFRINPARIDAIARACKNGISKAELKRRLARWEMQGAIQAIFTKEGLWPP